MAQPRHSGRSRAGAVRRRTLSVRLDADEYEDLERRARAAGARSLAAYLRTAALGRAVPRAVVPELNRAAWLELATTSRAVAEIAASLAAGHALDRDEASRLADLLAKVHAGVRRLRLDLLGVAGEGDEG